VRTAGKPATTRIAAAFIAPLVCALGVLGGIGSFTTIRHLANPWFGTLAWIVPVGIDLGITALLAWDLLAEYAGFPGPVLRWTAWAFIAATVYLNITAARGDVTAAVMHAAMPALFVTVVDGVRHLVRQATGLANGTRIEPIPVARWILAPRSSLLLFRHMVLWHITSYRTGLTLEHRRLQSIARLQQEYGHFLWRWRAPLAARLALRPSLGLTTEVVVVPESPAPPGRLDDREQQLVTIAAAMIRDAQSAGATLSQSALARQLREQGHRIANDRLRWLFSTAISQCSGMPANSRVGGP
jgi:Protein of unknown function (DUF2637)